MDAIEKRARELLDTELRKLGLHEDAYHVGCGAGLDRNDQAAINAIAAAFMLPEGYVAAPEDPSLAMTAAGQLFGLTANQACAVYQSMLAARTEVP